MRIAMTLALTLGLLSSAAQAQLTRAWAEKESGKTYFLFGAGKLDAADLNAVLKREGYSVVSRSALNDMADSFISFGLGNHGVVNGVLIGWELNGLTSRETTTPSGSHKTSLAGGYGFFNVGYMAYSMDGLDVYPMLGIGGGGLNLKIVSRRTLSFQQVMDTPEQAVELNTGGFLLNPALGIDYMLSLSGDEKREGGVIFGLRLGYVLAPLKGAWNLEGLDVSGGPQASAAGPYVRLMVGMGSRKSY